MDWLNVLAGFLVGAVVGITGVGGGSLMSPILILLFGVAPATAIGTDLWFAAVTKSAGMVVHHRQRSVAIDVVRLLALGSVPAALITGLWLWHIGVQQTGGAVLKPLLGAVLLLTAAATLFRRRLAAVVLRMPLRRSPRFRSMKTVLTVVCGAVLGTLVTLTSVGAGALGATMLLLLFPKRLTLREIVGTDIAHAVPVALIGGIIHLLIGSVDLTLLAMLLLGSIPGILLGSRLTAVIPERAVRPALSAVLVVSGLKLLL